MRIRILILVSFLSLFQNCFFPTEYEPSESGSNILTWFFIWGTISNANNYYSDDTCLYSNVVLPYTSCENAETLLKNGCKKDNINKGTIKYYKYAATADETLSMVVNPSYPSYFTNCVTAYKENKTVTTNSPISDLESNQSKASCQSNTSVTITSGSYRCISIHSFCKSVFSLKLSDSPSGLSVTGTGAANYTLPVWTSTTTTYSTISGTHAPVIGYDSKAIIPIGFSFTYFGQTFLNAYVATNGRLAFSDNYVSNILAPWSAAQYPDCNSSIQYSTTGTQGNLIFTVQWEKIPYLETTKTNMQRFNYQVKLYESTNIIEFIYGDTNGEISTSKVGASIFISASSSNIFIDGKTGSSSTKGSYSSSQFPASGTVYRFTP